MQHAVVLDANCMTADIADHMIVVVDMRWLAKNCGWMDDCGEMRPTMKDVVVLHSDYMPVTITDHMIMVIDMRRWISRVMRARMNHIMVLNADRVPVAVANHMVMVIDVLCHEFRRRQSKTQNSYSERVNVLHGESPYRVR
jgi:hypothetical protein